MNRYEPSTPRKAIGAIAGALTIATLGLLVAGPAALLAQGEGGVMAARAAPANVAAGDIRVIPAIEVVAQRDPKLTTVGARVARFLHSTRS